MCFNLVFLKNIKYQNSYSYVNMNSYCDIFIIVYLNVIIDISVHLLKNTFVLYKGKI